MLNGIYVNKFTCLMVL